MSWYLSEVRKLEKYFFGFEVQLIPRKDNFLTDQLAWIASSRSQVPKGVFLEQLQKPSLVDTPETSPIETASLDYEDTWMDPIYKYLQTGSVPDDDLEADHLSRKPKMYILVEGVLYKRGTQGVLMRCIPQREGLNLLHNIHGGIYRTHASYRTLVRQAFRQGFYWPTALYDAKELVKKCVQCQFHSRQIQQPG